MKNKKKHQAGFTLVELMITIAIIGILAAIAIPNFIASIRLILPLTLPRSNC